MTAPEQIQACQLFPALQVHGMTDHQLSIMITKQQRPLQKNDVVCSGGQGYLYSHTLIPCFLAK